MDFFHIVKEDAPRSFTIGFDQVTPALILGFHPLLLQWFIENFKKRPVNRSFSELLGKTGQSGLEFQVGENFGYGGSFVKGVQTSLYTSVNHFSHDFAYFSAKIPTVEVSGGVCESCGGGGNDECGWECVWCGGSGEKRELEWHPIQQVSATLGLLSQILYSFPPKDPTSSLNHGPPYQLVAFDYFFTEGRHVSIGAELSPKMFSWLRGKEVSEIEPVRLACMRAYTACFPSYDRFCDNTAFPIRLDKGRLSFDVPGNATGLLVSGSDILEEGMGVRLHCHNVDSSAQQLSLLCGLAALHDLALDEIG